MKEIFFALFMQHLLLLFSFLFILTILIMHAECWFCCCWCNQQPQLWWVRPAVCILLFSCYSIVQICESRWLVFDIYLYARFCFFLLSLSAYNFIFHLFFACVRPALMFRSWFCKHALQNHVLLFMFILQFFRMMVRLFLSSFFFFVQKK